MLKTSKLILGMVMLALAILGCEPDSNLQDVSKGISKDLNARTSDCGSQSWIIWAGQSINAGTLTVANDTDSLYVTYTGNAGVCFQTLHLWVGTDLTLIDNGGAKRPAPGQMPYQHNVSGDSTYTFALSLALLPGWNGCQDASHAGTTFYVVAHAEVDMNCDGSVDETGFGGDTKGLGKSWWYYSTYAVKCCENPPVVPTQKYGTAFAKGGYVFTTDRKSNPEGLPSLNLTKNRWGWAINVKTSGSTTYPLWTGAGLNDTRKGKLVGSVTVDYNGTQATVTYNLSTGFAIEEAHVYADDFKPTTLAPGQFGNLSYFNPFASTYSVTVDVTDTNGDGVWIIAHAVAYGTALTNP